MNLDIVVKPSKDGRYAVACPNFPECDTEGASVEEALEVLAEKIADTVAGSIKENLKESLKELSRSIISSGPIDVPVLMTNLPISLN